MDKATNLASIERINISALIPAGGNQTLLPTVAIIMVTYMHITYPCVCMEGHYILSLVLSSLRTQPSKVVQWYSIQPHFATRSDVGQI